MPTISITLSDSEWTTVQSAFAETDIDGNAITIDENYIKEKLSNVLTARVRSYDERRQSVTYSTFSPS
jgi:hypothetical protein